jgi:hypothetical protein
VKLEIKDYYEKQAVSFKISLKRTIFTAISCQGAYFKTCLLKFLCLFWYEECFKQEFGGGGRGRRNVKIREEINKINN